MCGMRIKVVVAALINLSAASVSLHLVVNSKALLTLERKPRGRSEQSDLARHCFHSCCASLSAKQSFGIGNKKFIFPRSKKKDELFKK